jgi:predicted ATPase/DNA-binding CsgD family transcriptional regulator
LRAVQAGASGTGTAALDLGDVPVAVRRIRSALGLSQEQLARRLGVSFATVNRWERGHAEPSPRSREVLARLRAETATPARPAVTGPLPPDRSTFVGRDRELAELSTLWPPTRLVTLTGPGGIGKTRLATELLRRSGSDGRRLVVVALDLVTEPALLASAIGAALGLPAERAGPAADVVQAVAGLDGVLLLDAAEHLAGEVRALLDRVFAAATPVRVLATSRVPLGVAGEQVWPVPPLRLPDPGLPRVEAEQADAVRLLVTRCRERAAALPGGDAGWRDLVALCRRLDGLPVALELAAGWLSTLTPGQLLGRLGDGTGPLAGPAHRPDPRSTVEWSAGLLATPDRALAGQLSVLIGPFTADDAAAVAGPASDLLGSVRRLVEASWLEPLPDDPDGEPAGWYRMLDPLRDRALSILDEHGAAQTARQRRAELVRELARQVDRRQQDAGWPRLLERRAGTIQAVLTDLANSSAGVTVPAGTGPGGGLPAAAAPGEPTATADGGGPGGMAEEAALVGAEIAVGLLRWWRRSGRGAEGRHWLDLFAGRVGGVARARAWCASAWLALDCADDATAERLAGAARAVLAGTDPRWAGRARTVASRVARRRGDYALARAELVAALDLHRAAGEPAEVALGLTRLGALAAETDDLAAAEAYHTESLDLRQRLGDDRSTATTLCGLAELYRRRLRPDLARAALDRARVLAVGIGDLALRSRVDTELGEVLLDLAEPRAAGDAFRLALETAQGLGSRRAEARALCGIGRALLATNRRGRAVRILQESLALATSVGDSVLLAQVQAALGTLGGEPVPAARAPDGLSARQAEVLGWLAAGLSDKDIARQLGIRASTVQRHIANVYQKLGVRNRAEAARFASVHGIGPGPPTADPPR